MKYDICLAKPRMLGNERKYMTEAFESNWIAPLGPFVKRFESGFADYIGSPYAVATSSGTAAIHLALLAAGVKSGDYVMCPAFTFAATANPIAYIGAHPVFIDSELKSFNMSPEALKRALSWYKPKAVIIVHVYGVPARIDEIQRMCEEEGAILIEDSTESLGATVNGKHTGTFGRFGCFSFNGNKMITTSGGGMVAAKTKEDAERVMFLATQAKEQSPYYFHKEIGFNYRMSNICAAIGLGQLEIIDEQISKKKRIQMAYKEGLSKHFIFQEGLKEYDSCYWLTACRFRKPKDDIELTNLSILCLVDRLAENGIEARPVWKPLNTQPCYKYYGNCQMAEKIFDSGICLPSDVNMTDDETQKVIKVVNEYMEGR